jgi:hypothetical protein
MRKTLKMATGTAVLFLALAAVVFVYANSQNTSQANNNEQQMATQDTQTSFGWCNLTNVTMPFHMRHMSPMHENGLQLPEELLHNATLATVQGTIVSEYRSMLILDTNTSQIRIQLPNAWTLDNQVVNRATLFNGTFASQGQSVTLKVLESDMVNNTNFSINIMMGYEAINARGTHAYAVLPFNIQTNS